MITDRQHHCDKLCFPNAEKIELIYGFHFLVSRSPPSLSPPRFERDDDDDGWFRPAPSSASALILPNHARDLEAAGLEVDRNGINDALWAAWGVGPLTMVDEIGHRLLRPSPLASFAPFSESASAAATALQRDRRYQVHVRSLCRQATDS